MGCTSELLKTGIYGIIAGYGIAKAITWKNPFWKAVGAVTGAAFGFQTYRHGKRIKEECKTGK